MALGSMSYADAKTCGSDLGTSADNMDNLISLLRSEMNSLEDVLKSSGGSSLYATYLELDKKLDGFPNKVRAFKMFLENAVSQYEADDAALTRDVG